MVTTRVTCTAKRCRSRIFSPAKCPSRRVPRGSFRQCVSTRRKQDRNAEPSKVQSTRAAGPTLLVHERQRVSSNSGDAHCVYDLRPHPHGARRCLVSRRAQEKKAGDACRPAFSGACQTTAALCHHIQSATDGIGKESSCP